MTYLPAELREYLVKEGNKLTAPERRALIERPDAVKKLAVRLLRKKQREQYPSGAEHVPSFDYC
jgi:hypothetical protein